MSQSGIHVSQLQFTYPGAGSPIIRQLSFAIQPGEFVAIQGPSGSGKSTLLYLLGAMSKPDQGQIVIDGTDVTLLSDEESSHFRAQKIGFIFQQFHLLPRLSLLENVELGGLYPIEDIKDTEKMNLRARELLGQFGLKDFEFKKPNQISGGQQQRVAIARALMQNPSFILADEPTGNLDSKNSELVMTELKKLHQQGHTIIMITHENEIAMQAERIIKIKDGQIESDQIQSSTNDVHHSYDLFIKKDQLTSPQVIEGQSAFDRQQVFKLKYYIKNALQQLKNNRLRTFLTMIGIIIGISAVLAMMTLGDFSKEKILDGYAEMGVNTSVFNGRKNWDLQAKDVSGSIFDFFNYEKDILKLKTVFPEILRISPMISGWNASIIYGGKSIDQDVRIVGINEDTFPIAKRKILTGRTISAQNVDSRDGVCIIGYEVALRLFGNMSAIGEIIFLNEDNQQLPCRVIGVAGEMKTRNEWRSPNLEVYVPFTYYQAKNKNWWSTQIRQFIYEVKSDASVEKVGQGIKMYFTNKYGKSGRFYADSDAVMLEQMQRFLKIFQIFLVCVALIALIVGGVGIANMMFVSINERLKEIGLRKALGATSKSIRKLILIESIIICSIAGIVGFVIGFVSYQAVIYGATFFVKKLEFEWVFNFWAIALSIASTIVVGVLSGIIPAIQAEKMTPIQALRSE